MSIFIESNLIYEVEFQRKLLMAVSVLTLEINSGIDIWSPESDGTFLLLAVHSISLPVYMWAVFHSKCRFLSEFCSTVLVHETHWGLCRVEVDTWPSHSMTYEIYCKSKALYWFCGMDWKLTFISQNPLTCSLFVYSQQSTCIRQLCSKIISSYFPLHSIMIFPYICRVDRLLSLFSTKQRSCFTVSF